MMTQGPITCEWVDQNDLDRRYVQGQLTEAEAAAFEEHFFGCDRCFQLVKGGAGVRAALRPPAAKPSTRVGSWWKPLAVAAGIGIVALGSWRLYTARGGTAVDGMRGSGDSLAVRTTFITGSWRLAWPAVAEATSYRVRVSASDGQLLFSRETGDTALTIAADSLPGDAGTALYLDVLGFDQLRQPVARSPLIPLSRSP